MPRLSRWFRDNSLWIVSLGLMLASSGIDGAYMTKWMPTPFGWLGLVLNTMSDVSGMVLIYWFGRLQQDRSSRKRRLSAVLLAAEVVAVLYSWLFSWRQLRAMLPEYETEDWPWVSAVAAGFIPLLLAFIGYAQSLLAGRLEDRATENEEQPAFRPLKCPVCGTTSNAKGEPLLTQAQLSGHMRAHSGNDSGEQPKSSEPKAIAGS